MLIALLAALREERSGLSRGEIARPQGFSRGKTRHSRG
jgi:hypothetical protein